MNAPTNGQLCQQQLPESVPLGQLAAEAFSLSLDEFVAEYPNPYLISEVGQCKGGLDMFQTVSTQPRSSDNASEWGSYSVQKSGRNKFSNMITIGRTNNNDIVLDEASVSKFHAYLKRGRQGWQLCDAGSRFGTTLGDVAIQANEPVELESGSLITLGTGFVLAFYTPTSLYNLLRALRAVGKL